MSQNLYLTRSGKMLRWGLKQEVRKSCQKLKLGSKLKIRFDLKESRSKAHLYLVPLLIPRLGRV
ncbi:hypothetical protein, partial [Cylindrospermopsis raciborskii]|uniref:hypothetical protein n=1 Tax=Cylindrospermopsis raciborskii TaxID=77022 RepID=UPI0026EFD0AE